MMTDEQYRAAAIDKLREDSIRIFGVLHEWAWEKANKERPDDVERMVQTEIYHQKRMDMRQAEANRLGDEQHRFNLKVLAVCVLGFIAILVVEKLCRGGM